MFEMTDKELRRLSRVELLELLIAQSKDIQELCEQLEEAQQKLKDREIAIEKAGSLAEASLALTDIFRKADEAAALYLDNIRFLSNRSES